MVKRIKSGIVLCLIIVLTCITPINAADLLRYDTPSNLVQMGMVGIEDICPYKLPKVTVAVIDNGIDLNTFESFFNKSRISNKSINMITGEVGKGHIEDSDRMHGTRVASVIAKGTPDNVSLMIIKASDDGEFSNQTICDSILYAVDNGADVINICVAGFINISRAAMQEDKQAMFCFKRANDLGIPIICSMGNEQHHFTKDEELVIFPTEVNFTCVLAVGSIANKADKDGLYNLSTFSNTGFFVDYVAIGENIKVIYSEEYIDTENNTIREKGTLPGYGTSFATPAVTAAYANVLTYYLKDGWLRNMPRTMLRVIRSLNNSCRKDILRDYSEDTYGHGVIDISYYIKQLKKRSHSNPNREKGCICGL